jgi:GNAT superfamily N-acetyltransferase
MVTVEAASLVDAAAILSLQRDAYQDEAKIYDDYAIPPLVQTLEEIATEFGSKVFLKAIDGGELVGSVRGYARGDTVHLERLMVRASRQGRGIGSLLVRELEAMFPQARRFELFTGHKSERNIALYRHLGYAPFRRTRVHPGLELVHLERIRD